MEELTERQQLILRLVVREYVSSATPVASRSLVERYDLSISPATVRNELALLEDLGYLTHPHTSAGRVPTEIGYRYFVERLMEESNLSLEEQLKIRHQFHQARLEIDQWLRLSAAVLAHAAHGASLVTAPKSVDCRLKHLELVSIRDDVVLLILVMEEGIVKQQILTLEAHVSQEELGITARRLSDVWKGFSQREIRAVMGTMTPLENRIGAEIVDAMERIDSRSSTDIYRDGLLNVLNMPDFSHGVGIQQVVRALEERQFVDAIVGEVLQRGGVQIIIGGEDRWEELSEVSIILARYGVGDRARGALGVLGPLRMPYSRAVSVVRYMSQLMSDLISDLYGYDIDPAEKS